MTVYKKTVVVCFHTRVQNLGVILKFFYAQFIFPHFYVLNMTIEVIHNSHQEYNQPITSMTQPTNYDV
jgi:hypothetical protein